MKILLLTTHMNIGGVGLYVLNLARGLKKKGEAPYVASSGGDLLGRLRVARIEHLALRVRTKFEFNPALIQDIITLIKFVKENDIDIIHAHTRVSQVMGAIVSGATKKPLVTTCHGFFKAGRLSRIVFPCWGEKTIAISEAVGAHLKEDFGVPDEKISVIYNGVDMADYDTQPLKSGKGPLTENIGLKNGPVIGAIGRLSPVKGYEYLLAALKDLKAEMPEINLIIIGDGPSERGLKELSRKLKVDDCVFFVKATLDIRRFLSIMDVFVFPSVEEGLGLSLLEALASGRACVASSIGGIPDIIEDGKNGILVPPRDPRALCLALKRVLSDKALSGKLETAARETVKKRFSLDKMVDDTIEFYKSVKR